MKNMNKRDLSITADPPAKKDRSGHQPIFVIQKHDSSSLHYDFRLEIDGVLVSWAVPKGPSTDPREKRLAIMTEDHPLEYANFEGVIPDDEYGAGTVLIWDRGFYRILRTGGDDRQSIGQALDQGLLTVWLEGEKLRGGYALTRTTNRSKKDWLLIKMKDKEADARRNPVSTRSESIKTGRTIEEIAAEQISAD